MFPFSHVALVFGLLVASSTAVAASPADTTLSLGSRHVSELPDTAVHENPSPARGPVLPSGVTLGRLTSPAQDTLRRQRPRAVVYSDAYSRRLTIHKTLSWAMLPLFAVSYVSGDQQLSKGADAPAWARSVHGPAAASTAALFGINTVTGAWNLWEGRADTNGRTRRIVHSVLFTAASAGFAYTGMALADEAKASPDGRTRHRNMALGSMGVSTASWLLMLIGN